MFQGGREFVVGNSLGKKPDLFTFEIVIQCMKLFI